MSSLPCKNKITVLDIIKDFNNSNRRTIMAEEVKSGKPKSALDRAFDTFEAEVADCKVIRKELISQLREDAKKMRVSEYDKAMMVTAKMSIVTTLNGMLKDVEDSALKGVKLQLSRTEQENNGQYSQAIVQLLKMVRADGKDTQSEAPVQDENDIQKSIEERGKELKITITEGELEETGKSAAPETVEKSGEEKKTEDTKEV